MALEPRRREKQHVELKKERVKCKQIRALGKNNGRAEKVKEKARTRRSKGAEATLHKSVWGVRRPKTTLWALGRNQSTLPGERRRQNG